MAPVSSAFIKGWDLLAIQLFRVIFLQIFLFHCPCLFIPQDLILSQSLQIFVLFIYFFCFCIALMYQLGSGILLHITLIFTDISSPRFCAVSSVTGLVSPIHQWNVQVAFLCSVAQSFISTSLAVIASK